LHAGDKYYRTFRKRKVELETVEKVEKTASQVKFVNVKLALALLPQLAVRAAR
jgi:hypothetical protein